MEKTELNEIKNFAQWLDSLSPFEFTTLGTIIGYLISSVLTIQEQNSVGNWFELVGQILLTFNAKGANKLPPSPSQYCNLENEVKKLITEFNILKNKLNIK